MYNTYSLKDFAIDALMVGIGVLVGWFATKESCKCSDGVRITPSVPDKAIRVNQTVNDGSTQLPNEVSVNFSDQTSQTPLELIKKYKGCASC